MRSGMFPMVPSIWKFTNHPSPDSGETVQDIEKGKKNPTYETLSRLVDRLGISADTLFPSETPLENEELQNLIKRFQSCSPKNQKILLNTLDFLAEQLPSRYDELDHSE